MKSNGLGRLAKSRKRKWVRYERLYSNAMWHTDWHVMKDPRMKDLNLITYLEMPLGALRARHCSRRPPQRTRWQVLRQAVGRFGVPATILSDNGSCFVGRGGRKRRQAPGLRPSLRTSC